METVTHDDTAVIVVKHPFLNRWIDQLVSELDATGKMWVFVHPYADDLPLEPAGLYSYVFPLVLDIFITEKASDPMIGCHRSNGYRESKKYEDVKDIVNGIKALSRKPALKSRGIELAAWACAEMNEGCREFFQFACLLFPLAVALDKKREFLEKVNAANDLNTADRRYFETFWENSSDE